MPDFRQQTRVQRQNLNSLHITQRPSEGPRPRPRAELRPPEAILGTEEPGVGTQSRRVAPGVGLHGHPGGWARDPQLRAGRRAPIAQAVPAGEGPAASSLRAPRVPGEVPGEVSGRLGARHGHSGSRGAAARSRNPGHPGPRRATRATPLSGARQRPRRAGRLRAGRLPPPPPTPAQPGPAPSPGAAASMSAASMSRAGRGTKRGGGGGLGGKRAPGRPRRPPRNLRVREPRKPSALMQ